MVSLLIGAVTKASISSFFKAVVADFNDSKAINPAVFEASPKLNSPLAWEDQIHLIELYAIGD